MRPTSRLTFRGLAPLIGLIAGGLLAMGCRHPFQSRMPEVALPTNQIVSLPPVVLVLELDFLGKKTEKPEWADTIAQHIRPELARLVVTKGGRVFPSDSKPPSEALSRFMAWSALAAMEIAGQKSGHRNYQLYAVGEWGYRRDLPALRAELNADLALTVLVRDIYQTTGSAVGSVLGGVHYSFMKVAVACVTDLRDGRMVWCDPKVDELGDLRMPDTAKRAVWLLLTDLYGLPKLPPTPGEQ